MLAAILGVALIAWTALVFNAGGDYKVAAHEKAQAEEQAKVEALAEKLKQEVANKFIDVEAAQQVAFEEGKKEAKIRYVKGTSYVAATPAVFNNPDCTVPPDGVSILNSARADMRTSTAADLLGIAVPAGRADPGRKPEDVVLTEPRGPSPVEGVRPQVQQPDRAGEVPGPGVRTRPKPTPIAP